MKPLISKCSMMPAWHQLVPISGHVEESETARKLQLYVTSIKTSVSTRLVSQTSVKMFLFCFCLFVCFFFLSLVSQILYWQNFACRFVKMSYFLNLATYMTCNLVLTAMYVFMLFWSFHFLEIQDYIISVTIKNYVHYKLVSSQNSFKSNPHTLSVVFRLGLPQRV